MCIKLIILIFIIDKQDQNIILQRKKIKENFFLLLV